ncbi:MAG: hypothetical protein FWD83_07245 [Promicromonosporaceae bacterium]|nr:hypothetical protein [Promicromonosporaceae bacterium]
MVELVETTQPVEWTAMIRQVLTKTPNVERSGIVWNTIVGFWFTLQPTVISFVIVRTLGADVNGQFAYAVAQAYLFWGIGVYGMRRYQASDVTRRFTFADYLGSRVVTTVAMIAVGVAAVIHGWVTEEYGNQVILLILLVLGLRMVDTVEDVYLGYFQQNGRLDIGSKLSAARSIVSTLVIMVAIFVTDNVALGLGLGVVSSALILAVLLPAAFVTPLTAEERGFDWRRVWRLLLACAPLCAATVLAIYVANAPRYAIRATLDDAAQGYFFWLALAPFLITLLSTIIFNPVITRMATMWTSGDLATFIKWARLLFLATAAVVAVALVGGMLVGVPVLNFITDLDFGGYRTELLVLLLAGGLSAWAGLFATLLTIVRRQVWFTVGMATAGAVALTGNLWVRRGELLGASWLYLALFAVQCLVLGVAFLVALRDRRRLHD